MGQAVALRGRYTKMELDGLVKRCRNPDQRQRLPVQFAELRPCAYMAPS